MVAEPPIPLSVQPLISYPREAQVGRRYLMTIDLNPAQSGEDWPYEEEEYPVYCMLDTTPLFVSKPIGGPAVVLHRFGGSYGPAQFILTATETEQRGNIKVILVNKEGVPLRTLNLSETRVVKEIDESVAVTKYPVAPLLDSGIAEERLASKDDEISSTSVAERQGNLPSRIASIPPYSEGLPSASKATTLRSSSPFVVGRPLSPEEPIFGRDSILTFLHGLISKNSSVNIVGERRMGKSSVIAHLLGTLGSLAPPSATGPRPLIARLDLQMVRNPEHFYGLALQTWLDTLMADKHYWGQKLAKLHQRLLEEPVADADLFYDTLGEITSLKRRRRRPLLVIDEFESLFELDGGADAFSGHFFGHLRALLSAELLTMIVASRLPMKAYFADHEATGALTSSFYNYFVIVHLEPLESADAAAFLLQPSDHRLNEDQVSQAWAWTAGHPCHLQAAGQAWYETNRDRKDATYALQRFEELKRQACFAALEPSVSKQSDQGVQQVSEIPDRGPSAIPMPIELAQKEATKVDSFQLLAPGGLPIPDRRPVIGRRWEKGEIARRIAHGDDLIVLWGDGGLGKSALARYTYHAGEATFPDGRFWLDLRQEPVILFRAFLAEIGAPAPNESNVTMLVRLARQALRGKRVLLVLDNAHTLAPGEPQRFRAEVDMLRLRAPAVTLVTTRTHYLATNDIVIESLTMEDSLALLSERLGWDKATAAAEHTDAEALIRHCGGHALALELAVERMRNAAPPQRCAAALAELRSRDTSDMLTASFDLSYGLLAEGPRRIFHALGMATSSGGLIGRLAGMVGMEERAAEEALLMLSRLALATVDLTTRRASLHPLLHNYVHRATVIRDRPDFADLVDIHMSARNLTHRELAARLEVDVSTIMRWRQGTTKPRSLQKVLDLALALELRSETERRTLIEAAGYFVEMAPLLPHDSTAHRAETGHDKPDFAELVNSHMAAQTLSDRELATRLAVDTRTIYRWRQGTSKPQTLEKVLDLASALELRSEADRRALIEAAGLLVKLSPQDGAGRPIGTLPEIHPPLNRERAPTSREGEENKVLNTSPGYPGAEGSPPPSELRGAPDHEWTYPTLGGVASVALSADGTRLVFGTMAKSVTSFTDEGEIRWSQPVGNQAWKVAMSQDGNLVVAGTGSSRPWDLRGRGLYAFNGAGMALWEVELNASTRGLSVAADGSTIAVGTEGKQLIVYDAQGHRLWHRDIAGIGWYGWVRATSLSADGSLIAMGAADKQVYLFRRDGEPVGALRASDEILTVSVSRDGSSVAAGDRAGSLYWLDASGQVIWRRSLADAIWSVQISADGSQVVVGTGEKDQHLHTFGRDGAVLWRRYVGGRISEVALNATGSRVIAGSSSGDIYIFDRDEVVRKHKMRGKVRSVALTSDGRLAVAGSEDGQLYGFVWRPSSESG